MRRRPGWREQAAAPGRALPFPFRAVPGLVRTGVGTVSLISALLGAFAFGLFSGDAAIAGEPDGTGRWRAEIAEASARFGVPAVWIEQVMRAESRGRTVKDGRPITSSAGAMGLMQLMPATWGELRAGLGLGRDPHAPRDNILAGTAYLREMYDRFGYPGLFAAYNAGPARYSASLASGRPLPAETRTYLAEVVGGLAGAAPRAVTSAAPPVTEPNPERPPRGGALDRPAIPQQTIFVALGQVAAESGLSQHRESTDRTGPARSGMDSPDGNSGNAMLGTSALTDPLFAVRVVP
ncbi:lytic transglycosylase domain-containing protein [Novosphingobium sp. TCA1]|uniref:lytic transglycosylase domain-containing protein n=1 Tax=Novosphingobium sp. TCA1 TaxID=2682474 RepID=UPI0035B544E3